MQRYKRHLFAGTQHAGAIKAEIVKLLAGTRDEVSVPGVSLPVGMGSGGGGGGGGVINGGAWDGGGDGHHGHHHLLGGRERGEREDPLTYEELGRVMEELLLEHGFYAAGC